MGCCLGTYPSRVPKCHLESSSNDSSGDGAESSGTCSKDCCEGFGYQSAETCDDCEKLEVHNSGLVQADGTIRQFTLAGESICAYKKFGGYEDGHAIFAVPCPNESSGLLDYELNRYKWAHDEASGLVKSVG